MQTDNNNNSSSNEKRQSKCIPFTSRVNHMNYVNECLCKRFIALRLRTVKNWYSKCADSVEAFFSIEFSLAPNKSICEYFAIWWTLSSLFSANYPNDGMIAETNRTLRFKPLAHWFRRKGNSFHNDLLDTIQLFANWQFRSFFLNIY